MTNTRAVDLSDRSGPAEARRTAAALAGRAGFDEQDLGRIALVVTELSTNVVKHAGAGKVILAADGRGPLRSFQALAIDSGPGFDFAACLRDGHSTAGTAGGGLGAITRLSDSFDVYSQHLKGSVLFSEIVDRHATAPPPGLLHVGGLSVAMPGEEDCGDAWSVKERADGMAVFVADGIGHGPEAAAASTQAVWTFEDFATEEPAAVMERVHLALRPTRGATVAMAVVDSRSRRVRYSGVGNISASIAGSGPTRHLVSHNGTAGREVRKIQQFEYPWPDGGLLVMASDGVSTRWQLAPYPGIDARHAAVVAGVLYRDFARGRDDATVVVLREGERPDLPEKA